MGPLSLRIALALHDPGRIVLQFSGGADSLACLWMLRRWWDRLVVMWTNPGAPLPETLAQMATIRALVPHFMEVAGSQPEWIQANGYPLDVVPVDSTEHGQLFTAPTGPRFQSYLACCNANLWTPMAAATRQLGATLVVRGQRDTDRHRSPIQSGDVIDGIEYLFPLASWTAADVRDYLRAINVELPEHYAAGVSSSLDCWNCLAYGTAGAERLAYVRTKYPARWIEIRPVIQAARIAIDAAAAPLRSLTE